MASLRDLNRDGHPFWAFVNSFEDISSGRPYQAQRPSNEAPPPPPSFAPGGQPFSGTGMPFRGPSASNEPPPIPQQPGARTPDSSDGEQGPDHEHRRRGSHGPRGHGGHGRGGHRSGWGRHGPRGGGPGCGQRGRGGPPPFGMGGPWNMNNFADMLGSFMPREGRDVSNNQDDFVPAVDVFDTEASYVVHVSLAGAKKEDTGVSWDPESSELSITGVIHRPGDEDFLKTLAVDERKVGAFQRKVRLGSRAEPAQVDMERISAKMEDGVLRIDVPKEDKDFVEVKKVDIQ